MRETPATQTCDGSLDCEATKHVHGCFSDYGNCDRPDEHPPLCHACTGTGFASTDPEDSSLCVDCGGDGIQRVGVAS